MHESNSAGIAGPQDHTLAHRIRQSVRWSLVGLGCASPAVAMVLGDYLGSL